MYGDWMELRGADALDFARDATVLIPGWLALEGVLGSGQGFGRFVEVWGADLRHTSAKG
jgi:hypothetical protein